MNKIAVATTLGMARAEGVTLTYAGGNIRIDSVNPPSTELVDMLRTYKGDVLEAGATWLPLDLWRDGLTMAESIDCAATAKRSGYCVHRGMDSAGWFVRCPWWQLVLDPDWVPANSDWGSNGL